MGSVANAVHREPWNKGKIVGQKSPFKLKDIWALRVRLQMTTGRANLPGIFWLPAAGRRHLVARPWLAAPASQKTLCTIDFSP
jgi:hypothetical protein